MRKLKNGRKKILIVSNNIECERHVQFFSNIEKYFVANNWELLGKEDVEKKAHLVIIASCGYHKIMYNRVTEAVKTFKEKQYQDDDIIIAGCLPKTFESQLKNLFKVKMVEFKKPELFDDIIQAQVNFKSIKTTNLFNVWNKQQESRNKMFYIKISDGCLGHCTYCVIKRAKGSLASHPKEEILKQYKTAKESGHRKIFLMGDDTFAYGIDINTTIIDLINYLLQFNDDVELYLGSLDIKWLKKYFTDIFELCKSGKIKKLDFGIQHIKDNILRLMGREREFHVAYEMIKKLKEVSPDLFISADIIVGFPGERQEDFDYLINFFKEDKFFNCIKHYGFSELEGTPVSKFSTDIKVHNLHIAKRWQTLKEVLGSRSMYNTVSDPDSQGEAFQRTFNEEIIVCKDSYLDVN